MFKNISHDYLYMNSDHSFYAVPKLFFEVYSEYFNDIINKYLYNLNKEINNEALENRNRNRYRSNVIQELKVNLYILILAAKIKLIKLINIHLKI